MKMRSKYSRRIRFAENEDSYHFCGNCHIGYTNASGICPKCGKVN